ncbi:V-type ATP synthase subunit D [bacterium]|nr:V-type ATP synthase subunit D [bacterium]
MSDRLDISPTRGNLLRLQRELESFRDRHELLDRKREIVTRELLERAPEAVTLEERARRLWPDAHAAITRARLHLGSDRLARIGLAPCARLTLHGRMRSVMGLQIPSLELAVEDERPPYGMLDTSAALDQARMAWRDVLDLAVAVAESSLAIRRLAADLQKTRRQVNALESTIIPRHERTIASIADHLEEAEREDIVQVRESRSSRNRTGG